MCSASIDCAIRHTHIKLHLPPFTVLLRKQTDIGLNSSQFPSSTAIFSVAGEMCNRWSVIMCSWIIDVWSWSPNWVCLQQQQQKKYHTSDSYLLRSPCDISQSIRQSSGREVRCGRRVPRIRREGGRADREMPVSSIASGDHHSYSWRRCGAWRRKTSYWAGLIKGFLPLCSRLRDYALYTLHGRRGGHDHLFILHMQMDMDMI